MLSWVPLSPPLSSSLVIALMAGINMRGHQKKRLGLIFLATGLVLKDRHPFFTKMKSPVAKNHCGRRGWEWIPNAQVEPYSNGDYEGSVVRGMVMVRWQGDGLGRVWTRVKVAGYGQSW
ncbi:hypothetical protein GQ457_15G015050 [Hibiscus cannabinus]